MNIYLGATVETVKIREEKNPTFTRAYGFSGAERIFTSMNTLGTVPEWEKSLPASWAPQQPPPRPG